MTDNKKEKVEETTTENKEENFQENEENEIPDSNINKEDDDGLFDNINNSKERKKRRSKNDLDGRCFQCKYCEKTYLSDIALNNHVKNKHSHLVDIVSRGRGRPRKNPGLEQGNSSFPNAESKFKSFFDCTLRAKNPEENFDLIQACQDNFNNIYTKYSDRLFKDITSPEEFRLLKLELEDKPESTCDIAFWKYLEFCKDNTNREYFDFIFKFVVLFRECINIRKGEKFTETDKADCVPDMCNEFVSEFMETYDYFGLEVNELIEAIQHCCHWLWENHHTTSRLTLVNN